MNYLLEHSFFLFSDWPSQQDSKENPVSAPSTVFEIRVPSRVNNNANIQFKVAQSGFDNLERMCY